MVYESAATFFWDFDGVIKDSINVKTEAFIALFQRFGIGVTEQVRKHHEAHGGMSRFEKIPIYLRWAGLEPTDSLRDEFCDQFGRLVLQKVIEAPWVPGVETYIRSNPHRQTFILISATPQGEIETILRALNLTDCFAMVYGSPTRKNDAIRTVLVSRHLLPNQCLVIGDSRADFEAAESNQVPFVLLRHETNREVFADYTGPSIKDFTEL